MEQDCSGCASGSVLVLRRDGAATCTWTGHARFGTEDRQARSSVSARDFDELARAVLAQGFFELQEDYEDLQLQDGAWVAITVVRNGQVKRVFSRNAAGPPSLRAIEAAVEAVRERLHFVPACR